MQIGLQIQACKIWWINELKSPSLLLVQKIIFSNDLLFVVVFPPERSIWNGQRSCLHSQILVRPGNPEFDLSILIYWVYVCRLEPLNRLTGFAKKRSSNYLHFCKTNKISQPEPLNNLGEKYEDLELSEPLANAHAGALAEREAHKRMNRLLWEKIHELLSKAHHTYIFFLGFHPSFWQEHFGVVDKLKRRWKHVIFKICSFTL